MLHPFEVPVFRVMQFGEAALHHAADEVQGKRGATVSAEEILGIGNAARLGESGLVDDVAPAARESLTLAGFHILGARFRVLTGEAPNSDHLTPTSLHQQRAHPHRGGGKPASSCKTRSSSLHDAGNPSVIE